MREIKFRAFSKENGMWFPDSLTFDVHGQPTMFFQHNNLPDDVTILSNTMGDEPLMQFTGLMDKNGVEIYEGDIVKRRYAANDLEPPEHMAYDDWIEELEPEEYIIRSGVVKFYPSLGYKVHGGGSLMYLRAQLVDVIGNVHQNPELLKETI